MEPWGNLEILSPEEVVVLDRLLNHLAALFSHFINILKRVDDGHLKKLPDMSKF
jgi:hypothetical protein